MKRDSITLKDLDDAGRDVRAWCFDCARGAVVDTIIWQKFDAKGWPMTLTEAARRMPCRQCGSIANVALFPARRPPVPLNAPALLVERFFHGMRSVSKKGGANNADAVAVVIAAQQRRLAAKSQLPDRQPPNLRLVWPREG